MQDPIIASSQPVQLVETASRNDDVRGPEPGMALSLSGGGYRAMLFHLGALWRLNELGSLRGLKRISSVSGGSITAAMLGLKWDRLGFGAGGDRLRARDLQGLYDPGRGGAVPHRAEKPNRPADR